MSDSRSSGPGFSLLWLLLLLPIAPAIGWGIGKLPTPATKPAPVEVVPVANAPAVTPAPSRAARSSVTESAPAPEAKREQASAEVSSWTSLESAIAESQRNGKPVMIDFSAEWCGPCRHLKREVFDDFVLGRQVQTAVIPVAVIDRAQEEGQNPAAIEDLQRRYGVEAFPTLVVFSPATGRIEKKRGYGDPQRTLEWITAAAKSVR